MAVQNTHLLDDGVSARYSIVTGNKEAIEIIAHVTVYIYIHVYIYIYVCVDMYRYVLENKANTARYV